jgi:hypothetical protein
MRDGLMLASNRGHEIAQLVAPYQARQRPPTHTEQRSGLALISMSQRHCVNDVPPHDALERLEIVSHFHLFHSSNFLLRSAKAAAKVVPAHR